MFTLRLAIVINHVAGFSWPTYETSVTILAHVVLIPKDRVNNMGKQRDIRQRGNTSSFG